MYKLLKKTEKDGKKVEDKMKFRKIEIREFDKLKKLFPGSEESWEKYRKMQVEKLRKRQIDIFVLENDETIIGEITANYKSNKLENEAKNSIRAYLEAFRVDRNYRGQGLGQKLINYCIDYLENIGYTEFTIGVEDDNKIAKHIYSKLGFIKPIGRGYGDEFDESKYTLYLKEIKNNY